MAGALGTLGVLTEISFKVLPRPPSEVTLSFTMEEAAATKQVNAWAGQPLPLSGTAWLAGRLLVRLSGAPSAVAAARAKIGGDEATDLPGFWESLRDQRLAFFDNPRPLWRISVPQTAAPIALSSRTSSREDNDAGSMLIEWGGGQRWVAGDLDVAAVRKAAQDAGGHATLFRHGDKSVGVFHPLRPAIQKIHRRLKSAFDPAGILNPGRMYAFGALDRLDRPNRLGTPAGQSREDQKQGG
jgi:glycolate oxidase FAD binding subunit